VNKRPFAAVILLVSLTVVSLALPGFPRTAAAHASAATEEEPGTWQAYGPAMNQTVTALAIDPAHPATVYAGTDGDAVHGTWLLKSTDGGDSWTNMVEGLYENSPWRQPVNAIAIAGNTVYAGLGDDWTHHGDGGGVFETTDGGETWQPLTYAVSVSSLEIDPTNSSILFAGTSHGVWWSSDGGSHWATSSPGMPSSATVTDLAIDPTSHSIVYAATSAGLFKSTNGGYSWQQVNDGLPESSAVRSVQLDPTHPLTLYAGTEAGVYKSSDGATTWAAANDGLNGSPGQPASVYALALVPSDPQILYAATDAGVFKSTSGATGWASIDNGLPLGPKMFFVNRRYFDALAVDGSSPSTVYAGVSRGYGDLFKTTDAGASWSMAANGFPPDSQTNALVVSPTSPDVVYAGTRDYSCVWISTDSGRTWQPSSAGIPHGMLVDSLAVDPVHPDILYAGTESPSPGLGLGVYQSTDGGKSWSSVSSGLPADVPTYTLAIDPKNTNTVYAGTEYGVYKTTNGGQSWVQSGPLNVGSAAVRPIVNSLVVDPSTPATVYAGTAAFGVLKSIDGGGTWIPLGFPSNVAYSVAIDPKSPSTLYAATQNVYRSTTGGVVWLPPANPWIPGNPTYIPEVYSLAIDPSNTSTIYAGSHDGTISSEGTVWVSADGGTTWADFSSDLPITLGKVSTLAVSGDGSHVYAGSAYQMGVYVFAK
jgi:photosystem II stability/assembly factor-like uncharacterized protein